MIKPSFAYKRYHSAQQRFFKQVLDNFFSQTLKAHFGPVIREKLIEELILLLEQYSPEAKKIKPGQILWTALDKNTRGDSPNRKFVPVILTIISEEDIKELAKGKPMSRITKKAIVRMYKEAYIQGGILSSRDVSLLTLRSLKIMRR